MIPALVLVTRILGLVNNEQPIYLQVDPGVARVEVVRDGQRVAELRGAPWQTVLDFGPEIAPHELTAVAYDGQGNEIGRDTQIINLARPAAEITLDLVRDGAGSPRAVVKWQHIAAEKVKKVQIKLDGKVIGTKDTVALPQLPPSSVHVVEAEVRFADGFVAKAERAFGGQYGEALPAELTAMLVRKGEKGDTDLKSCFQLDGALVAAAGVEEGEARVLFVRDADPSQVRERLSIRMITSFPNAKLRYIWPIAEVVQGNAPGVKTNLFQYSREVDGRFGLSMFLRGIRGPDGGQTRFVDAVAVAGVHALVGARRRAVVLIVDGNDKDHSRHHPATVRRYLERVGVPLRVWSLAGKTPALVEQWGDVTDTSTGELLRQAAEELKRDLTSQRVVWVSAGPLETLRIRSRPDCAYTPVAKN